MNSPVQTGPSHAWSASRQLLMLVRREWWEHVALRWMPLVLVGLTVVFAALALVLPDRLDTNLRQGDPLMLRVDGQDSTLTQLIPGMERSGIQVELGEVSLANLLALFGKLPDVVRGQVLLFVMMVAGRMALLPLGFLAAMLALGTWRREIQDRSIAFHKSMPVGEGLLVLSKALVGGPVLFGVMALTVMLVQVVPLILAMGASWGLGLDAVELLWTPVPFLRLWSGTLSNLMLDFLAFLPAMGLLAALNVWHPGRRMLAAGVVFAVGMADSLYLSHGAVFHWLGRHLLPPGWSPGGLLGTFHEVAYWRREAWGADALISPLDLLSGVALGVGGYLLAAWLLRWREER